MLSGLEKIFVANVEMAGITDEGEVMCPVVLASDKVSGESTEY